MKTHVLAVIIVLLCNTAAISQQASNDTLPHLPCSADDIHTRLLNTDPAYRQNVNNIETRIQQLISDPTWRAKNNSVHISGNQAIIYTIPVVVHIMHLGEAI